MSRRNPVRVAVRTPDLTISTRRVSTGCNLVIYTRQRIAERGRPRETKVWGVLEPAHRKEFVTGLLRQYAGGMHDPRRYRRVLSHGDLRVKVRGTPDTGFGIVLNEEGCTTTVAGHLTGKQFERLMLHLTSAPSKPTRRPTTLR